MFSGIVQAVGEVARHGARLSVRSELTPQLQIGESIAVSGACLTLSAVEQDAAVFDVMPETLRRTALGALRAGDRVNLERSLALHDLVGGHLVTGHVDATGTVRNVQDEAGATVVEIDAPRAVLALTAAQGSIAVDGISLTVVSVDAGGFSVSLVPHTQRVTTAGTWRPGTVVNLEADLVARYIRRMLGAAAG